MLFFSAVVYSTIFLFSELYLNNIILYCCEVTDNHWFNVYLFVSDAFKSRFTSEKLKIQYSYLHSNAIVIKNL